MSTEETRGRNGEQPESAGDATIEFLRLGPDDLPQLLAMETLCFPTPWNEKQFKLAFEMNLFYVFGLKSAGVLRGYISFYCSVDHMEILNFAIAPAWRSQGLGRRLLGLALKISRKLGAAACVLEVRESNVPARRLYDSFGFQQVGLRKGYYTDNNEDAVVMRLEFAPQAETA